MIDLRPVTLEGRIVRLEPLSEAHVPGLAEWGWSQRSGVTCCTATWTPRRSCSPSSEDLLAKQARGTDLPFAVVFRETGKPVGCTRFMNI